MGEEDLKAKVQAAKQKFEESQKVMNDAKVKVENTQKEVMQAQESLKKLGVVVQVDASAEQDAKAELLKKQTEIQKAQDKLEQATDKAQQAKDDVKRAQDEPDKSKSDAKALHEEEQK